MDLEVLRSFPKFPNAECAKDGIDPDLFFPDSALQLSERLPELQQICGKCPHQAECLDYALKFEIYDGIWAGTTPDQRKKLHTAQPKEAERNKRHREIRYWLSVGFTKDEVARKLGIKVSSLERTLERAAKKGLQ